jgi:hypothetical protein
MRRKDCAGENISIGDLVRVGGVPDLSRMSPRIRKELEPVFHHLKGKYKRIRSFNEIGWAEIEFRIRQGKLAGHHTVWMEPTLLRRKS